MAPRLASTLTYLHVNQLDKKNLFQVQVVLFTLNIHVFVGSGRASNDLFVHSMIYKPIIID